MAKTKCFDVVDKLSTRETSVNAEELVHLLGNVPLQLF